MQLMKFISRVALLSSFAILACSSPATSSQLSGQPIAPKITRTGQKNEYQKIVIEENGRKFQISALPICQFSLKPPQIPCREAQSQAIADAVDFGEDILRRVQGLARLANDDSDFGKMSAKDLRILEKRYFGRDQNDRHRKEIVETVSIALKRWHKLKFMCHASADFLGRTGPNALGLGLTCISKEFDQVMIGRGFELLSRREDVSFIGMEAEVYKSGARVLIHEMLHLAHDPQLTGLVTMRSPLMDERNPWCEAGHI